MQRVIGKVLTKAKARDRASKYHSNNRAGQLNKMKIHYADNQDKRRIEMKASHSKNRQARCLQMREYGIANRKNITKQKANRRKTDEAYVVELRARSRLKSFLKQKSQTKNKATFQLIGLRPKELHEHLMRQRPGFDLKHGHCDHIFPFKLYTASQLDQVMHFSNLQPLTESENLEKRARLPTKEMAAKVAALAWPDGISMSDLPDSYENWSTPLYK